MHLLYMVKRPLRAWDFHRFGFDNALARGWRVTVLDMSDYLFPGLDNTRQPFQREGFEDCHITDHQTFLAQYETVAEADLVILYTQSYGHSRSTLSQLRMLKQTGTPYLVVGTAPFVPPPAEVTRQHSIAQRLRDMMTRLRDMDVLNSIVSRLPRDWLGIPPAAFVVYASAMDCGSNSLVGPKTKEIYAHTLEYDRYLAIRDSVRPVPNQAVFLDQYLPFHPDFQELGAKPLSPEHYYSQLNHLFDRLEREHGLKVIIAAHPRSDYSGEKYKLYGNRDIVYGNTEKLVGESSIVLTHNSNAAIFSAMFRRPIAIFTTSELYTLQHYEKIYYDGLSSSLGTPLRFYDDVDSLDLTDVFHLDEECYNRYLASFISHPAAPERPYWDIVFDCIQDTLSPLRHSETS